MYPNYWPEVYISNGSDLSIFFQLIKYNNTSCTIYIAITVHKALRYRTTFTSITNIFNVQSTSYFRVRWDLIKFIKTREVVGKARKKRHRNDQVTMQNFVLYNERAADI